MAVFQTIIPFSDEVRAGNFVMWDGTTIPDNARVGRFPSPNELESTMLQLSGYSLRLTTSGATWAAALLDAQGYQASEFVGLDCANDLDQPCSLHCAGDTTVLKSIIEKLPESCGSYIIATDGDALHFVTACG